MGNDESPLNIKISYNGILKEMKCNKNMTVKELINKYKKEYLNSGYNINNFTLKINNNNNCSKNSTIETYKNDINNNSIFYLIYDNNKQNIGKANNNEDNDEDLDESDDDLDDLDFNENNIILESCKIMEMEINMKFFKNGKNNFNINYN